MCHGVTVLLFFLLYFWQPCNSIWRTINNHSTPEDWKDPGILWFLTKTSQIQPVTRALLQCVTSGEVCIPFQVITLEQPRLQWCNFTTVVITTVHNTFHFFLQAQCCLQHSMSNGWRHFSYPETHSRQRLKTLTLDLASWHFKRYDTANMLWR